MPSKSQQPAYLRASVIDRFRRVAIAPDQERKFPVGPESAKKLGYDPAEVDALPSAVTESFCGVGNPFSAGRSSARPDRPGSWVRGGLRHAPGSPASGSQRQGHRRGHDA